MDETFPFLHPVVIDGTKEGSSGIPEYFTRRQWQKAPDGRAPPEFLERIREIVRECRKRKAGLL